MLKSKKAILPALIALFGVLGSVGSIILIIIAVLGLAAGIYWISNHILLLLGGFIITLTLWFGIPMTVKKPNKKRLTIVFVFIIFGLLITLIPYMSQQSTFTRYYYSGNVGLVKINYGSYGNILGILNPSPQAVTFFMESVVPGAVVSFRDDCHISAVTGKCTENTLQLGDALIDNDCMDSSKITIYKDGAEFVKITKDYDKCVGFGKYVYTDASFTAAKVGNYKATTSYYITNCPPTTAPGGACKSTGRVLYSTSFNNVTVKPDACPDATCGDYIFYKYISNGEIDRKDCPTYDSNCYFASHNYEYMTVCNDRYVVPNTDYSVTAEGEQTCVVDDSLGGNGGDTGDGTGDGTSGGVIDNNTIDTSGVNTTSCDKDYIVECSDGTSKIAKKCVNGVLQDFEKCTSKVCYKLSADKKDCETSASDPSADCYATADECETLLPSKPASYDYMLIGLIGGIVVLVFVFLLVISKIKK